MKLNYKKMVKEINEIVQTDFMFDMDCKALPNSKPFTQEEAQKMCDELMNIYRIAHCYTCTACNEKYVINPHSKRDNK